MKMKLALSLVTILFMIGGGVAHASPLGNVGLANQDTVAYHYKTDKMKHKHDKGMVKKHKHFKHHHKDVHHHKVQTKTSVNR